MSGEFFIFELSDYAVPGFISWTKEYFGTLNDFRRLLDGCKEERNDLRETFEKFAAGKSEIKHYAGQLEVQFARPTKLLDEKEFVLNKLAYSFQNVYNFIYKLRMTKATGRRCLFQSGEKFYVAFWARVERPRYQDDIIDARRWIALDEPLMGHPGMIRVDGKFMENTLGVLEKTFDSEAAAREYYVTAQLNWNRFYEEVFGDG